jgi:large conductance mechanosensitive channel
MAASGKGGLLAEFSKFIMQGNVIDLAVAVIIGVEFGKIIESLVKDILTPAVLSPALKAANVSTIAELSFNGIKYGSFLAAILNFLVIAFSVFLVVQALEAAKSKFLRKKSAEEAAAPPDPIVVSQENLTHAVERLTQVMESR